MIDNQLYTRQEMMDYVQIEYFNMTDSRKKFNEKNILSTDLKGHSLHQREKIQKETIMICLVAEIERMKDALDEEEKRVRFFVIFLFIK